MAETKSSIATPVPSAAPAEVEADPVPSLPQKRWDLISPCKREGISKLVHRECLDYDGAVQGQFAFAHCTTCKVPYYLRAHIHPGRQWRIFNFLKFRYILFMFAMIQLVICALANILYMAVSGLTYLFHGDNNYYYDHYSYDTELKHYYTLGGKYLITSFASSVNTSFCGFLGEADRVWFALLLIMELSVIGLVISIGIFCGINVATFFGQQIWRHHYYVVAKRIMAKEYVVEDMSGEVKDWCPPLLPPEHVQELKQLGLL